MSKGLWVAVGLVGGCAAVGVGAFLFLRNSGSGDLTAALAEAKKLGLATEAKDLVRNPSVADRDNAAKVLHEIQFKLDADPALRSRFADFTKTTPKGLEAPSKTFAALNELGPLPALAVRASKRAHCDFDYDWSEGGWTKFPELVLVKQVARMLVAQALAEARVGKTSEAVAHLQAVVALGSLTGETSTLIHALVRTACEMMAMSGFEKAMETWARDPGKLKLAATALLKNDFGPDYRAAIRGELWFSISTAKRFRTKEELEALMATDLANADAKVPPIVGPAVGEPESAFARGQLLPLVQYWTKLYKATDSGKNYRVTRKAFQAANDELESRSGRPDYLLAKNLLPILPDVYDAGLKVEASRRCLIGLAAALEYKARRGRYPGTLAEAGFKKTDPFNGKPLHFKAAGSGCIVYSVGPDEVDDHGARQFRLPNGSMSKSGFDVIAAYPAYRKR